MSMERCCDDALLLLKRGFRRSEEEELRQRTRLRCLVISCRIRTRLQLRKAQIDCGITSCDRRHRMQDEYRLSARADD